MSSKAFSIPSDLIRAFRQANHVAVLTGAGISAESGIPTFRDAQTGFWSNFKPEELASAEGFLQNPKRVWEWYAWRREKVADVKPNPGHFALAEMERHLPRLTLITQNVDGLHRRAGSKNVLELHGNILKTKCFDRNHPVESWEENGEIPPLCPQCGGRLRPDVVWFGEMLPERELALALQAAQTCDLFLSVGTSSLVYPAASLPEEALHAGIPVLEINPTATPLTPRATWALPGPSGRILPELVKMIWP
ncbi:MAG: NAD-dependent deacylase [bacterium]